MPVPFDPDEVWGTKPRHPVRGTVDGVRVRGVLAGGTTDAGTPGDDGPALLLGAAWVRHHPVHPGTTVAVTIEPEGPQRDDLAVDLAEALAANPAAARFWDGLAQFYRRAYLRWVDGASRRPEVRAERVAAMVELLEAGVKDHRQGRAGSSST